MGVGGGGSGERRDARGKRMRRNGWDPTAHRACKLALDVLFAKFSPHRLRVFTNHSILTHAQTHVCTHANKPCKSPIQQSREVSVRDCVRVCVCVCVRGRPICASCLQRNPLLCAQRSPRRSTDPSPPTHASHHSPPSTRAQSLHKTLGRLPKQPVRRTR